MSAVRHKMIQEHIAEMSKPVLRGQFETWFQFRQGLCQVRRKKGYPFPCNRRGRERKILSRYWQISGGKSREFLSASVFFLKKKAK